MAASFRSRSNKDTVEQAVASGRNPYTLGLPEKEVRYIVASMNNAAKGGDPREVPMDCTHTCPCGENCDRDSLQEGISHHTRHRCQPHKWWDLPDFQRRSPVWPIQQIG